MSDSAREVPIEDLVEWFNEHARQTDADETAMAIDLEMRPVLSDSKANFERDKKIGEILSRKALLQDFKGMLIAKNALADGELLQFIAKD